MSISQDARRGDVLNALQRLIDSRRTERRLSYADIARAGGLPKSTVYKLAITEEWSQVPHPDTLDKLARGLGVPAHIVRAAAAEASGLTASTTELVTDDGLKVLVGSIESLTEDQRRQVAALVDAMIRDSL